MTKIFLALISTSVLSTTAALASRPSMYCGLLESAKIEQVRDSFRSDWVLGTKAEAVLSHASAFNPGQKLPTQDQSSDWVVKITDIRAVESAIRLLLDDWGFTKADFLAQPFSVNRLATQSSTLCVEAADYPADGKTSIAHRIFKLWGYQGGDLVVRQVFQD